MFPTPKSGPAPPKVPAPLRSGKLEVASPREHGILLLQKSQDRLWSGWEEAAPSHPPNLRPAPTQAYSLPRPTSARPIRTRERLSPGPGETQVQARPISAPPVAQNPERPYGSGSLGGSDQVFTKGGAGKEKGKGHPESVRDWSRKSEGVVPGNESSHLLGGCPGFWPRKVRRRPGEGEAGRPARATGVALSSGRDLLSPPRSEEGAAQEGSGSALALAVALIRTWGAEGLPPGEALTVMAAPRGGESRRQEGGKGSRAGLSGAGIPPPPPPPPLSAGRRRSSGPSLPRRCPSPFHPPIKLFFFFQTSWEDPGGPMGGGEAETNSGGGRE